MVETLEQTHDVAPVTDQGAAGIEAVFDLPTQGAGLPFEFRHGREVFGKAFHIIVEITAHAILEDNQGRIDIVEEFVDRFDEAEGLLCREYFEQFHPRYVVGFSKLANKGAEKQDLYSF